VKNGATATNEGSNPLTTATEIVQTPRVTYPSIGFTIVAPNETTPAQATSTRNAGSRLQPSRLDDFMGFAIFSVLTLSCFMVLVL
jgi:hypothetical protein